jgi:hybrid cluster-associated redox disulfide protein
MKKGKITRDMTLGDIVKRYPETVEVMLKHGMHCVGCHVAAWETLEQGARSHGIPDKDIESMLKEMNEISKNLKKKGEK